MWSEILYKYGKIPAKYYVGICSKCGNPIFEYDTYFVVGNGDDEEYFCGDCCREA